MRRRMLGALTLAAMMFVAVNTSYAQTSKGKVRTVSVKVDCVTGTGNIIVGVNRGSEITLRANVDCNVRKDQIRKFILKKTLGKVVTVSTFPSRLIIPSGDILLPGGQSLTTLITA